MKTLLSSAVIVLAIAATTSCAKAECVSGVFRSCSPPADDVAKRPKPQQADEKAPAVSPPPALPPAVTQKSPVDGLRAGDP